MSWHLTLERHGDETIAKHEIYSTETEIGRKPNAEMLDKLKAIRGSETAGVLPPAIRWVSPGRKYVILERPPMDVNVAYFGMSQGRVLRGRASKQDFRITVPWTVYCIGFDQWCRPNDVYVFCRPKQIYSTDDQLFLLPFTNTYANGRFCLPDLPDVLNGEIPTEPWSLAQGINTAFQQVWDSNFNTDITEVPLNSYRNQRPKVFFPPEKAEEEEGYMRVSPAKTLKKWEALSLEEVMAIEDWPMPNDDNHYTVAGLMSDASRWETSGQGPAHLYNTIRYLFM